MRKVCKKCKLFVTGNECPLCKGNDFTENWKGRIFIVNPNKSEIAKRMEIKEPGQYASKVR